METTFGLNINEYASTIAIQHHAGTVNKHDGEIYLAHVARVAYGARRTAQMFNVSEALAEATGWLHDVVEDTSVTVAELTGLMGGYDRSDLVVEAVRLLTKTKGEPNEPYYQRIKENPLARCVKLSDLADNFSRNHAITDPDTAIRMARKYSLGMEYLMGFDSYKLPETP